MKEDFNQSSSYSAFAVSLWLGLLLPPIFWALQMLINYALVGFECFGGRRLSMILVSVLALIIAVSAGGVSLNTWRKLGNWGEDSISTLSTNKFLAFLGLLSGGLFTLVIVAQLIGTILLHPCLL